ncbi:peptidoglycan-recognition protein SC2-like protein [Dinothrombium tinctorium]|uniref:Peptidoglycan-recognition protein n=1 Tax=Dinothrombium tinctorium TaxID=1965070 RepID=A0A3S3P1K0_9ACAR|nr:peptidoglycan-recognition protein SC2-like protein [Dinothrombium tinctorium]RWR99409.1 peptidoglycan-recognition protein SC2-like protein [Dinothrombium tinctorium]
MRYFVICSITVTLFFCILEIECCPRIVSRAQWGARKPRSVSRILPVRYVVIHHTVTGFCNTQASCSSQIRSIQRYHMDSRGWSDIGYNFLVGGDGNIYEGRGWNVEGAHARGLNRNGIGISFIGNFQARSAPANMMAAAKKLIQCGLRKVYIMRNYQLKGHRDVNPTSCPGNKLYRQMNNLR